MNPRLIPEELLRVQFEASDPSVSAWVAANAGSGKTHVLAQRVIRLMLDGADPAACQPPSRRPDPIPGASIHFHTIPYARPIRYRMSREKRRLIRWAA